MTTNFVNEHVGDFDPDRFINTDAWVSSNIMDFTAPTMSVDDLDDLPAFLDRELETMDLDMSSVLKDDLEIPMLSDTSPLLPLDLSDRLPGYEDSLFTRSDSDSGLSSDSGSAGSYVKLEPLSPASSFSDNSNDYMTNEICPIFKRPGVDILDYLHDTEIKLENPPLTPPHDANDRLPRPVKILPANQNLLTSVVVKPTEAATNQIPIRRAGDVTSSLISASSGGNGRLKIVPRPEVTSLTPAQNVNGNTVPGTKPLVLSAEDFQRLATQGLLRFNQPPAKKTPQTAPLATVKIATNDKVLPNHVKVAPETIDYGVVPPGIKDELDLRTWKRQQRMIKNRESACLSRKRKKEHLQTLEERLNASMDENQVLKCDNAALRKRVDLLQRENDRYKRTMSGKAACVMVVVFMVTFNLGSFTSLWQTTPTDPVRSIRPAHSLTSHRSARHLLSLSDAGLPSNDANLNSSNRQNFEESMQQLRETIDTWNSTVQSQFLLKSLEALSVFNSCPSYFNKTESSRLADELTGWVMGHKKPDKAAPKNKPRPVKIPRKIPKKYRSLKFVNSKATDDAPHHKVRGHYQVEMFNKHYKSYSDFFDAIERRNDTFYVVSFRRDHLLLPATAHNRTMRPRMSLVMPAVGVNDSLSIPKGSVAMMQIDCEVMNTKLIHVIQSAVPNSSRDQVVTQSASAAKSRDENVTSSDDVTLETIPDDEKPLRFKFERGER